MDDITISRQFELTDTPIIPVPSSSKQYAAQQLSRLDSVVPVRDEPNLTDMHEARFNAWQLGMTYDQIAAAEGLESDQGIRRSVNYCLLRMGMIEQIQARNSHTIARAHESQGSQYFTSLAEMFKEKSWMAKSAALKHFRKTVALEGQSVITVNVDNRKQSVHTGSLSFESAMTRVRAQHMEEEQEKRQLAAATMDAEVIVVPDAEKL